MMHVAYKFCSLASCDLSDEVSFGRHQAGSGLGTHGTRRMTHETSQVNVARDRVTITRSRV